MSAITIPERLAGWRSFDGIVYRDNGCDLFARCTTCELPACRYDLLSKRVGRGRSGPEEPNELCRGCLSVMAPALMAILARPGAE